MEKEKKQKIGSGKLNGPEPSIINRSHDEFRKENIIEERDVQVNGIKIHYLKVGSVSKTLLLVHWGFTGSSEVWRRYIADVPKEYTVIAPDLPGYGKSDSPKCRYTINYYSEFIGDFLKTLNIDRTSIVAQSVGGAIALGFAIRQADSVEKLALINSFGLVKRLNGIRQYLFYAAYGTAISRPILDSLNKTEWFRKIILKGLLPKGAKITEDMLKVFENEASPEKTRTFGLLIRNELRLTGIKTHFVENFEKVKAHTLIINGSDDTFSSEEGVREAARRIPNSELVIFEGQKHGFDDEHGEKTLRLVMEFLKR